MADGTTSGGGDSRRGFLSRASTAAMAASLLASGGAFAALAGRFLLPARPRRESWIVVCDLATFARGTTRTIVAPTGQPIVVAREPGAPDEAASLSEFVALSSVCPHLGCQVRFEPQNDRFFCPCHNGTFDRQGTSTGGPPFEAGQSLPRYELRIDGGLLLIRVPVEGSA
jgi:nitrite reductase/ring-hydroxylating ferredoxin subunit